MGKRCYSEKEILSLLKEAHLAPRIGDVIRRHRINPKTYYRWKAKYGGSPSGGRVVLQHLKTENERLKLLVAKQALEIEMLRDTRRALHRRPGRRKGNRG